MPVSKEQMEYATALKNGAKELIDGIRLDSEDSIKILELTYGFVRYGYLKSLKGKVVQHGAN